MGAKKELHKYSDDSNGWPRPRPGRPHMTTAGVGDYSNDNDDDDASDDGGHQHGDGQNGDENLAYQAMQAKRAGKITDTRVIESKIMIKYRYMCITQVTCFAELDEKTQ